MSKFNVGDKVRYIKEGYTGKTSTVLGVLSNGLIKVDTHGKFGACYEKEEDLEHVGPIRTVTRREIIPGVYGRVHVGQTGGGKVVVSMGGFGMVMQQQSFTANELREAAHILNQLAEALDDA